MKLTILLSGLFKKEFFKNLALIMNTLFSQGLLLKAYLKIKT